MLHLSLHQSKCCTKSNIHAASHSAYSMKTWASLSEPFAHLYELILINLASSSIPCNWCVIPVSLGAPIFRISLADFACDLVDKVFRPTSRDRVPGSAVLVLTFRLMHFHINGISFGSSVVARVFLIQHTATSRDFVLYAESDKEKLFCQCRC